MIGTARRVSAWTAAGVVLLAAVTLFLFGGIAWAIIAACVGGGLVLVATVEEPWAAMVANAGPFQFVLFVAGLAAALLDHGIYRAGIAMFVCWGTALLLQLDVS